MKRNQPSPGTEHPSPGTEHPSPGTERPLSDDADGVHVGALTGGSVVKNLPGNAGDTGDKGPIPGSGRSPVGGNGNPL